VNERTRTGKVATFSLFVFTCKGSTLDEDRKHHAPCLRPRARAKDALEKVGHSGEGSGWVTHALVKPRRRVRCASVVWPPSHPRRGPSPRTPCPLCPCPDVLPSPDPRPRPLCATRRSLSQRPKTAKLITNSVGDGGKDQGAEEAFMGLVRQERIVFVSFGSRLPCERLSFQRVQ